MKPCHSSSDIAAASCLLESTPCEQKPGLWPRVWHPMTMIKLPPDRSRAGGPDKRALLSDVKISESSMGRAWISDSQHSFRSLQF